MIQTYATRFVKRMMRAIFFLALAVLFFGTGVFVRGATYQEPTQAPPDAAFTPWVTTTATPYEQIKAGFFDVADLLMEFQYQTLQSFPGRVIEGSFGSTYIGNGAMRRVNPTKHYHLAVGTPPDDARVPLTEISPGTFKRVPVCELLDEATPCAWTGTPEIGTTGDVYYPVNPAIVAKFCKDEDGCLITIGAEHPYSRSTLGIHRSKPYRLFISEASNFWRISQNLLSGNNILGDVEGNDGDGTVRNMIFVGSGSRCMLSDGDFYNQSGPATVMGFDLQSLPPELGGGLPGFTLRTAGRGSTGYTCHLDMWD